MKIGICMPYMVRDYDRARILNWAGKIDEGPFDSLSSGERVTGYSFEMHSLLVAAAAVTKRVRIMPSLYVLPMRSAVLTAKEAATLDVISGGRVAVTVGVGSRPDDFRAVGAPFAGRFERMDDQVAEMRRVWAGEAAFPGGDVVGPVPHEGRDIPIYMGSLGGPKGLARAAKWADGIYGTSMAGDREGHERIFDSAKSAWQAEGRTEKPYLIGSFWCSLSPNAEMDLKSYVHDYMHFLGEDVARATAGGMTRFTPDAIREAIENVREAGADELLICPATAHYDEIDGLSEIVARL